MAIDDSVFHSRAVPSGGLLENDPDVMIHQQLARLNFFEREVGTTGKTVLDFGCGSGFNSHLLQSARRVVGFDNSPEVIAVANSLFPRSRFLVADGCDPRLNLGTFERIICCEVLEHVPDMPSFIKNIFKHLTNDGIAFITTPNVKVFSNGYRPSPMNREHIRELDIDEFRELLQPFEKVRIYGQKFCRAELAEEWAQDVERKATLLKTGNRWPRQTSHHVLLRSIHSCPPIKWVWRLLRWRLIAGIQRRRAVLARPYSFHDFDFVENDFENALWFCAVVSRSQTAH